MAPMPLAVGRGRNGARAWFLDCLVTAFEARRSSCTRTSLVARGRARLCPCPLLAPTCSPLSLPAPYDEMWLKIQKVIDPLHLKNHTRSDCKTKFNPEVVRKLYPQANFMQCEQTFAWLGRYKKILNSTPKAHFNFLIHRLVIGRNKYTVRCYGRNKRPLLPSAKIVVD